MPVANVCATGTKTRTYTRETQNIRFGGSRTTSPRPLVHTRIRGAVPRNQCLVRSVSPYTMVLRTHGVSTQFTASENIPRVGTYPAAYASSRGSTVVA